LLQPKYCKKTLKTSNIRERPCRFVLLWRFKIPEPGIALLAGGSTFLFGCSENKPLKLMEPQTNT